MTMNWIPVYVIAGITKAKEVDLRPDTSKMTVYKFADTSRYRTILYEIVSDISECRAN
jgi:hypothetical protein